MLLETKISRRAFLQTTGALTFSFTFAGIGLLVASRARGSALEQCDGPDSARLHLENRWQRAAVRSCRATIVLA